MQNKAESSGLVWPLDGAYRLGNVIANDATVPELPYQAYKGCVEAELSGYIG